MAVSFCFLFYLKNLVVNIQSSHYHWYYIESGQQSLWPHSIKVIYLYCSDSLIAILDLWFTSFFLLLFLSSPRQPQKIHLLCCEPLQVCLRKLSLDLQKGKGWQGSMVTWKVLIWTIFFSVCWSNDGFFVLLFPSVYIDTKSPRSD